MGLEGSLKDFGIADILQIIYYQKKTGSLIIEGRFDRVKILFKDGNIVAVESRRRLEGNRLGRVLVKKGLLSMEELDAMLKEQVVTGLRLGEMLIKKGIDAEVIKDILVKQFTETLVQILGWKEGYYEFRTEGVSVSKELPIYIDTQHMLMDGLRIMDEYSIIGEKITSEMVFERVSVEAMIPTELSEQEKTIMELINGENDLGAVIELSGLEEIEVSKAILKLLEKGLIRERKVEEFIVKETPHEKRRFRIPFDSFFYLLSVIVFLISLFWFKDFYNDLERLLAFKDIERLSIEMEIYNIKEGDYPATLEDIIHDHSALGLRDPWGSEYIYRLYTTDGFKVPVIMSAGRDKKPDTPDDIY